MSINRVFITGNVARDPELRVSQSGTAVLSLAVAVDARRKDPQTGQWEDAPCYIDAAVVGNRAAALADRIRKGARVAVEGHLRHRSWGQDGQRRSKLDVVADEVEFMSPRSDG